MSIQSSRNSSRQANLLAALLVVLGLLAGAYFSLRFGGWTMEVDASRQAVSADGILSTGSLINRGAYNNGFGYGAQLAVVSLVTGIDLNSIQLSAGVWVFALALAAFVTYREVLGSAFGGGLAAVLLLIQPDFLFYVIRGSHERSTWTCALLMIFFLARSLRVAHSARRLAANVGLFYLAFWGMTAGNVYFSSTFMLAIVISLGIGWSFERLFFGEKTPDKAGMALWRRLVLVSVTCLIIIYIFINYLYLPAQQYYSIFKSLIDQISILFLGAQPISEVPTYQYFTTAWRSQAGYLAVSGAQWAVAFSSLGVWLWLMFRLGRLEIKRRLLWQLYTSFGILLAIGVVADFSKFLNSNLQLRMFTPFALFSSPLVAYGIMVAWPRLGRGLRRILVPVAALLAVFAVLAVQLKITNDPIIGNQWMFYSPAEVRALEWVDHNMEYRQVWVDTSSHLQQVFRFLAGYDAQQANSYRYEPDPAGYPYVMVSELTLLRANRSGLVLPSTVGYLQIYDNGMARCYHRRPQTPYQK